MNRHLTPLNGTPNGAPRRRRAARPLELFATLPDERTAAAMDDAAAARQLIDDLVALVDAGLVVPIEDDDEIRYAPVESDERDAA
jgi:hypothetical protein